MSANNFFISGWKDAGALLPASQRTLVIAMK